MHKSPIDLGNKIQLIDLFDLSMQDRTGSYIFMEKDITIIETSASPSIPYLLKGLEKLNVDLKNIKHVIVTHIHLDHAGGAGLLLQKCPNATLYVHPRGLRHLVDPSRLIAGARAVYKEQFDELFNPIVPVEENRIVAVNDGEKLEIANNRVLTFYDSPGHALHHMSIHDSLSNGIFTGDTLGVYYHTLQEEGLDFVLPSTSPSQFNPDEMMDSLNKIKNLNVDYIYFGHFGKHENPNSVYSQIEDWLPIFMDAGFKGVEKSSLENFDLAVDAVCNELRNSIFDFLYNKGFSKEHEIFNILEIDLQVCSMGIVDYISKKNKA